MQARPPLLEPPKRDGALGGRRCSTSPARDAGLSLTSYSCQPSSARAAPRRSSRTPSIPASDWRATTDRRAGIWSRASSSVPSKRLRPLASSSRRSHSRSACCITWVEKMTVAPPAAARRISSSSRPWLTGSRPEKGSSRISRRGRLTTAVASWTFCAMPLDNLSMVDLGVGAEAEAVEQRHPLGPRVGRRHALEAAEISDRVDRRHLPVEAALLGQEADVRRRSRGPAGARAR